VSERVEARGSVQLAWPRGRPRRPAKVVERAIEAIEALRPAFRPTLFQINLRLRGSDELPGRWLWSLEERGFDDELEGEGDQDAEVVFRVVDRIGRDAMEKLAREALAGGDAVDISSVSVEVRSARPGARPVEMEIWALSDLSIDMDWPLGEGGEPPAEIDRAVARLVALGWEIDEEPADLVLAGEEEADEGPVRHDRPVTLQLYWTGPGGDEPLGAAMLAVDACAAFAPLAQPASAAIEVAFADLGRVRPDRFRFAHEEVGMELEAIRRLVREALAAQRPAGLTGRLRGTRDVDWIEIAVRLRPPGAPPPDPVVLIFSRRAAVHLEVQLRAPEWSDPASAGRDRIERLIAALARGGWKRAPARP
jgi:hypothetical protein